MSNLFLSNTDYGIPFGPGYSLYLLRRMPLLSHDAKCA
nr:hypothetical protein [Mucilaginibacter sp. E4BP6]